MSRAPAADFESSGPFRPSLHHSGAEIGLLHEPGGLESGGLHDSLPGGHYLDYLRARYFPTSI